MAGLGGVEHIVPGILCIGTYAFVFYGVQVRNPDLLKSCMFALVCYWVIYVIVATSIVYSADFAALADKMDGVISSDELRKIELSQLAGAVVSAMFFTGITLVVIYRFKQYLVRVKNNTRVAMNTGIQGSRRINTEIIT